MRRWITIVTLGVGVLVVHKAYSASQRPRRVLVVGNSLVAHGGLCEALEQQLPEGSLVSCEGYPGKGIKHIRVSSRLAEKKDLTDIVILAGVNDIAAGRSLESIKQDLTELYEDARSSGSRVIAVTLLPWDGHYEGRRYRKKTSQLNGWILGSHLPDRKVFTYTLGNSSFMLKPEYDSGDHLHLNSKGQEALGLLIHGQGF